MNSSDASPQRMYLSSVSNEIISAETWSLDKEISYSVERNGEMYLTSNPLLNLRTRASGVNYCEGMTTDYYAVNVWDSRTGGWQFEVHPEKEKVYPDRKSADTILS